jgi:hypothetical protein
MLCKWMDVENCKFLEALDHGMLTNDRDLRLALAEVRGVKRGLEGCNAANILVPVNRCAS